MEKKRFDSEPALFEYIDTEHKRWEDYFAKEEFPEERSAVTISDVLDAHFHLVHYFADIGEGIGGIGPKSPDLLISALARQFSEFGGKQQFEKPIEKVASLLFGLVKNHPFHDANKRTAFLTSVLHLQKIGRTPTSSHEEYEDFIVDISDNQLGKYVGKSEDITKSNECVQIISEFLRKNTRDVDLRVKIITFNELNRILSSFDLYLDNPKNNRIDVIKKFDPETEKPIHKRICKIGFHGWSREVSRTDIAIVREAAKLGPEEGYDSQAFFNGAETPLSLIKKYEQPLRRLAFR